MAIFEHGVVSLQDRIVNEFRRNVDRFLANTKVYFDEGDLTASLRKESQRTHKDTMKLREEEVTLVDGPCTHTRVAIFFNDNWKHNFA